MKTNTYSKRIPILLKELLETFVQWPLQFKLVISFVLALILIQETKALTCRQVLHIKPNAEAIRARNDIGIEVRAATKPWGFSASDNIDGVALPSPKKVATMARALVDTIESNYGPLQYKKDAIGLDWDKAKAKFFSQLSRVRTENDLLFQLSELLMSFNDAHVSVQIPSSLKWTLPIQLSYTSGSQSYIVNWISPELASRRIKSGSLPPLGAKLISINGSPVEEFRAQRSYFNASGNELTNRSLFARQLFSLNEASGIPLSDMGSPTWDFVFEHKTADGQTNQQRVELTYAQSGVALIDIDTVLPARSKSILEALRETMRRLNQGMTPSPMPEQETKSRNIAKPVRGFKNLDSVAQLANSIEGLFGLKNNVAELFANSNGIDFSASKNGLGQRYGMGARLPSFRLPPNFKEISLPEGIKPFFNPDLIFAGTFLHQGKRVGLLRIPTYGVENIPAASFVIDYLVKQLELNSDLLILDQMDNPGGSVTYADFWIQKLVGRLDKKKHMQFKVKPTHHFMRQFAVLLDQMDKTTQVLPDEIRTPLLDEMSQQFNLVHQAFVRGDSLSEPITLLPMFRVLALIIAQNRETSQQRELFEDEASKISHYTKPIYMLINQFDFSGGDATPANLQDYGRVKLLGMRTAGAGGTVENFSLPLMATPFNFALTTSLMFRPASDTAYVENVGVKEHFTIEPTEKDYLDGFQDYFAKVLEYIMKDLIK